MDFFDLLKELRSNNPSLTKARKAMKVLGWICIGGAIWNCAIFYIAPFDESPFNLPPSYPFYALFSLLFIGSLFLYSAQAISKSKPNGKKIGQAAIFLLVAIILGFMYFIFPLSEFPIDEGPFSIIFIIFLVIAFAQFGIPAFYVVRYLGRLTLQDDYLNENGYKSERLVKMKDDSSWNNKSISQLKYKEALIPFGVLGIFALLIAIPLLSFFAIDMFDDPSKMIPNFMATFVFIFFALVAYNFIPSTFQKQRKTIESFTGEGSIFLFNGTWPFFRLLVYEDGIEIRVMLHRFFVPYDKMEDIPEKVGFFSRGILIKTELPGVPSGIRYQGFGIKKVTEIVIKYRNIYTNNNKK
ncbi:membrane protein [Candidatus Magnetomorum sp. HK-1]|nr:membrane protein [Candidatus Magnetomorum sp. HK-1]